MIRHSALFRLKHPAGSAQEADFLAAAAGLKAVPGVLEFQIDREISPKNGFDFVLSMAFVDAASYEAYNVHPQHVAFVENRWLPEVVDFMEHDSVAL